MTHSLEIEWTEGDADVVRDLEVLWVNFVKLQRVRTETISDLALDDVDAQMIEAVLKPIATELCRLALVASTIAANCREDIEYKAVMLAEFLSGEDTNIQMVLTKSLVKDIKYCSDNLHVPRLHSNFHLPVASSVSSSA